MLPGILNDKALFTDAAKRCLEEGGRSWDDPKTIIDDGQFRKEKNKEEKRTASLRRAYK